MSAVVTPIPDDVFTALRAFILGVIGGSPAVEVIKGLGNRVAMPPAPFIAMTSLFQIPLATNVDTWDPSAPAPTQISVERDTRFDIQIDCYGPNSGAWAAMLTMLFRDDYACRALAPNCQPLYAEDARQMAFVSGEQQYIERWSFTAAIQYNPTTVLPQAFADVLAIDLINVNEAYSP
jgi:hypothetical protein